MATRKRRIQRQQNKQGWKRVSISIPKKYFQVWADLPNKSGFVQLCLDDAAGLIAWNTLQKHDPEKYVNVDPEHPELAMELFKQLKPLNKLTKARLEKATDPQWPKNSPNKPELW